MRKQVGVCLIATGKYKQFVRPLMESINKNFLLNHDITIFLFSDDKRYENENGLRIKLIKTEIPSYRFPEATLLRYQIFNNNKDKFQGMDFLFYMDVDMSVVGEVGDEILGTGLTAVHHPGYYVSKGWGSPNNSEQSLSYLPKEKQTEYFAGGFQGGQATTYLSICAELSERIADDTSRGVMAEWHDETFWNFALKNTAHQIKKFDPSYCMVEQQNLRELWGIADLQPKIIALAKNHAELRS